MPSVNRIKAAMFVATSAFSIMAPAGCSPFQKDQIASPESVVARPWIQDLRQQPDKIVFLSSEDHESPMIPNLRTSREPKKPWLVESGDFSARVKATTLNRSLGAVRWRLDVDLNLPGRSWQFIAASSSTPDVVIRSVPDNTVPGYGSRRVTLDVSAPTFCSTAVEREPVILSVDYADGSGALARILLEVDHRCLLGSIVPYEDSHVLAAQAETYQSDPEIKRLLARARSFPRGSVEEEILRLKQWVRFDDESIEMPPNDDVDGWNGNSYKLTPTETVRLGGCCRDWSTLVAAYLVGRGFKPFIALTPGHVWVQVTDQNKVVIVDLVAKRQFSDPPTEITPVFIPTR